MAHEDTPQRRRREARRSEIVHPQSQKAPECAADQAVDPQDLDRREARQGPSRKHAGPPKDVSPGGRRVRGEQDPTDSRITPDVAPTDPT